MWIIARTVLPDRIGTSRFHKANNGGGELRGFIVAVPEPSRVMFALIGLSLVVLRRKR